MRERKETDSCTTRYRQAGRQANKQKEKPGKCYLLGVAVREKLLERSIGR